MNKFKYLLAAFTCLLFALIVARVDNRIFASTPAATRIQSKVKQAVKKSKDSREKLEAVYATAEDPRKYVLIDPVLEQQKKKQAEHVAVKEPDTLRVTGLMQTSDGVLAAVVNGSLFGPGDKVLGCEIKEISKEGVLFSIEGKDVRIPIGETIQFKAIETGRLVLEEIISQAGRNLAVFSGRVFKVGDWISGNTQVKAIAPSVVMVAVDGKNKTLRIGETL